MRWSRPCSTRRRKRRAGARSTSNTARSSPRRPAGVSSSCRSCSARSSGSPTWSCSRTWSQKRSSRARACDGLTWQDLHESRPRDQRERAYDPPRDDWERSVTQTPSIRAVVERHDVVVCAGSGGVGKTTTAATIALWGAKQGRRAAVLTIDPARRLADSLGLPLVGGAEVVVPPELLREHGITLAGSLSAMMLDQKGAWDSLVERHAPSEETRERILKNRFYQHLSQSFAGSQEYMAVEELARLRDSGRYDLIVVDTPPSRHALEFLEAPQRLNDFLDRKIIRWFVKPYVAAGWSAMRLFNRTAAFVLRTLEEATGVTVLAEISDFFGGIQGLLDGFGECTGRVYRELKSPKAAFVMIWSSD